MVIDLMEIFHFRYTQGGVMYFALGLLQAFIAVGAIWGGFVLVMDPSGAGMGMPVSMLEGSIFPDFFVPGLFLLLVNGFGSLSGALLSFLKKKIAGSVAITLGAILVAWIVIQVSIIDSIHWLHVAYFTLGLVELATGVALFHRNAKPA